MSTPNYNTAALLAPDTILQSRYRVIRRLGKGGMGAVYEAIDLRLGHTVAVKQTLTNDEEQWKLFEREARLLASLNHPALPRVSDYFIEANRAFFVMQFIEGGDLAEIIAQQPGPLPRHSVIAWADQLLDALIYLHSHERQIIHRDIKPHNLKITETGRIVLLDFGLAKAQGVHHDDKESGRSIFGYSPRYAPLEQVQDVGTTPQSDIYALGATLYHLLTGVRPPDALARATALVSARPNPLKPANEINETVGVELAAVLTRAMAQNPDERYSSATEFREALRQIGRVDATDVEFVACHSDVNATVVGIEETALIRSVRTSTGRKLGRHSVAAAAVIMLAALGVFCRYYPWKIPAVTPAQVVSAGAANVTSEGRILVRGSRRLREGKRTKLNGATRSQSTSPQRN